MIINRWNLNINTFSHNVQSKGVLKTEIRIKRITIQRFDHWENFLKIISFISFMKFLSYYYHFFFFFFLEIASNMTHCHSPQFGNTLTDTSNLMIFNFIGIKSAWAYFVSGKSLEVLTILRVFLNQSRNYIFILRYYNQLKKKVGLILRLPLLSNLCQNLDQNTLTHKNKSKTIQNKTNKQTQNKTKHKTKQWNKNKSSNKKKKNRL